MRYLSSLLLVFYLSALTLVASPKPAGMTTKEIINELKLNSQGFVTISTGLWKDSVLWRKRHEILSENLEVTETKLINSLETIEDLETQVSKSDSLLIEAEDFSKSLNEDNLKLSNQNTALLITGGVLVATTVVSLLVAIFR